MRDLDIKPKKTMALVWLLAPALILLFIIVLIPSLQALAYSFTNFSPARKVDFIGITNYKHFFSDTQFFKVLLNNLYFLFASLFFEIILGFIGALLLNKRFRFQPLWVCLILAPYAVSPVVSVVIWKYLLDPSYGIVNYLLTRIGVKPVIWFSTPLTSLIPISAVSVWKNFPFLVIVIYAALSSIPEEIIEAAKIDGVQGIAFFKSITLPLISSSLIVGVMFRMIYLIRTFELVWVFTGGGPGRSTEILAIHLYKEAFLYLNFGKASALAWILLVITFALSGHLMKSSNRNLFQ